MFSIFINQDDYVEPCFFLILTSCLLEFLRMDLTKVPFPKTVAAKNVARFASCELLITNANKLRPKW